MRILTRLYARFAWLQGAILPLSLLLLWDFLSRQGTAYAYVFVPVADLWRALLQLIDSGDLQSNWLVSLRTTVIGLLAGGGIGLIAGSLMGISRIVDGLIGPLYHALRQVPLLGWVPLIGLWFGSGELSKELVVCLAAFYPLALSSFEGIRNVEQKHLEVARVLKIGRWQLFKSVLLPSALPMVITGVTQALAFAWISTVGSELLFSAGTGLGGMMETAQGASRMDEVMLCVVVIGSTGLLMNYGISMISQYLLRWRHVR